MRVWKSSILLFVGLAILVMTAVTVSAVTGTDDMGDVYDGALETAVSKPNIDITTMTYELSGNTVTLTMKVNGNIMDSEYIKYSISLSNDTNPFTGYMMQYINGTSYVVKLMGVMVDSEVSISQGNTIIGTFTLSEGESTDFNLFWGIAMEHSEGTADGRWIDVAPNDYLTTPYGSDGDDDIGDDDTGGDGDDDIGDDDTGGDDDIISPNGDDTGGDGNGDGGGGTPGFEILAVIVALAIALIILRRKKL